MTNLFQEQLQAAGARSTQIAGNTYTIILLPASSGLEVGQRIIKVIAPMVGILVDSEKLQELLLPEEQNLWTQLSVALVNQMGQLNLVDTIKAILAGSTCNGQVINFDNHFRGNYGQLIALVEFALKENFGDFFTDYLRAKGLSIPTLSEILTPKNKDEMLQKSEQKLTENAS